MPKRKNQKPETVDELLEEMESAENIIEEEIKNVSSEKPQEEEPEIDETEKKRYELLKLAENGDLGKSIAYIKKASKKVINKIHPEYQRKSMEDAYDFLTGLSISLFSKSLGGFDAIESPDVLFKELQKNVLLKRNVKSIISVFTPIFPFLGILSGGVTTAKHIYDHKTKTRRNLKYEETVKKEDSS